MKLGPGTIYDLPTVGGPSLYPPTTYLGRTVWDEAYDWYDELFPILEDDGPAVWSVWGQIVTWAAEQGLPLMYAAKTAGSGPKLACTDPDTIATCVAFWRARLLILPDKGITMERSDGDGNWDEDPGNREQLTMSPAQRLYYLANAVREVFAVDDPGVTVGILAYARCAVDLPEIIHPGIAYEVAGPAYLPGGVTVASVSADLISRGATYVKPYVYWASWYIGEGTCLLMDPTKVIDTISAPRLGSPDRLGGAVTSWTTLAPSTWALARCIGLPGATVDDFVRARWGYVQRVFPTAWASVHGWYDLVHEGRATTPDLLHRLYQHCVDALDATTGDEQQRVSDLALHTRYLDLLLTGTDTERIAWLWSIAHRHVVDVRIVAHDLGVGQGKPDDGVVLEPGVDDPCWVRALCVDRLGALALLPWDPEQYPDPEQWPGDGDSTMTRGTHGIYWRPHKDRAGSWWCQSDTAGLVTLTLQGGWGTSVPDLEVGLYDTDGGLQHTWTVPGTMGVSTLVEWDGAPLTTYEIRSHDGGHKKGLDIDAAAGLRLAYRPDPAATQDAMLGTTRVYVRLRPGATTLGLYSTGTTRVWAPGVKPNVGWSTGWMYESTENGHHTISIPADADPDGLGVWVAVSGALVVPLHGAAPYLCRRPDEGPEVSHVP